MGIRFFGAARAPLALRLHRPSLRSDLPVNPSGKVDDYCMRADANRERWNDLLDKLQKALQLADHAPTPIPDADPHQTPY